MVGVNWMRYFIHMLIYTVVFFSQSIYSQVLSTKIDEIIEERVPRATVGVLIKDLQTGEVIYSKNANKLLVPASSTKLFTAAAALYYLKPDFQFVTSLSQKDQNYYLTFTGSPSLTADNLIALLGHLKENNVKTIKGNIVIDSTHYPPPFYLNGYSYDDLGWSYASPDMAAILNRNAEVYELKTTTTPGSLVKPSVKSTLKALTVIDDTVRVSKEEGKNECTVHLELKGNNTIRLFGCVIQEKNSKKLNMAITDPVLFVEQVIQSALEQYEITLTGKIIRGTTPSDANPIAVNKSADLIKLIKHMLQMSDNLYANSLTRTLGFFFGNG